MTRSAARLGVSAAAREVESDIALAAASDARVLISGERGVGKGAVARIIHAMGRRRHAPFLPVRCAVSEQVLESQLFGTPGEPASPRGSRRGALECADGGTLFLGDVAEAGSRVQHQLLRFIDGDATPGSAPPPDVDVRLVASADTSILGRVVAGQFREELFYRLNVVHITLPPLRDRREDIAVLLTDILSRSAADVHRQTPELTAEAWQSLCEYDWPGNMVEMRRIARGLVAKARVGPIGVADLPPEVAPIAQPRRMHHA
jgi:DNA-binding NtrC family response regulator